MTRFLYRRNRRTSASRIFLASLAVVFMLSFTGVVHAESPEVSGQPNDPAVSVPVAEEVASPAEDPQPAPSEELLAAPAEEVPVEEPVAEASAPSPDEPEAPEAPSSKSSQAEVTQSEEVESPPDAGGYSTVDGNPATPEGCFKIGTPSSGAYCFMLDGVEVTVQLTITDTEFGQVMSWTSSHPMNEVVVKGGPMANIYSYTGATSGSDLHAPLNANNNMWYGISHVTFCPEIVTPGPETWNKRFALTIDGNLAADVDSLRVDYMLDGVPQSAPLSWSMGTFAADVAVPDDSVVSGWVFYAVVGGQDIALTAPGGSETITEDTVNAATFTPGTISGIKYIDCDRDEVSGDPDDVVAPDWTITLEGPGLGDGISATTGADGSYMFSGLLPGLYSVDELLLAGFYRVDPLGAVEKLLSLGDMTASVDFVNGEELPGPDTWNKRFELDINGTISVDVESFRVDYMMDGQPFTAALLAHDGGYHVDVTVPNGAVISDWVFFAVVDGQDVALTSAGGSETITADATNTASFTPGSISGVKYIDFDRDGAMAPDADDIAGSMWTITLDGPGLGAGVTDVTDGMGFYEFTGLLPGTYSVDEMLLPGYTRVAPLAATDVALALGDMAGVVNFVNAAEDMCWNKHFALTIDGSLLNAVDSYRVAYMIDGIEDSIMLTGSDGSYHGDILVENGTVISDWVFYAVVGEQMIALTVPGGTETITADATNTATFTPGTIEGIKYIDTDMDSALPGDTDDARGAGWTITLDGPGIGEPLADLTDASGAYEFAGLLPGEYLVDEVINAEWVRVFPASAATPELALGEMLATVDFVNAPVVTPVVDMEIEKVADRSVAEPGDLIVYEVTYRNVGNQTIDAFTIVDDYPQALVTVVNAGGAVDNGDTLTWSMATPLAPGASGTLTYSVRVDADVVDGTNIDNVVTIVEFEDTDTERVVVESPFLPFTDEDVVEALPFLPFTGVELLLLLGAASFATGTGVVLRRYARR